MPRVAQRDQYKRHLFLRTVWTDPSKQAYFADLSANEQWKLYSFYRPSEVMTLKQFRDHLRAVRYQHPQLCHISGKLYRRVEHAVTQDGQRPARLERQARHRVSTRRGGTIVAYGVVRPKLDLNKLLKALIKMAREEQAKADEEKH